jgi:site-specific recombinase XerD
MFSKSQTQRTISNTLVDDYLLTWIEAFMIDRKARGVAGGTLKFYGSKLKLFADFCESQVISQISQITPSHIRTYILHLEGTGHNAGGRHAAYRTLRAFLYWYEDEVEPEGWKNPIRKVKAPKVPLEPLEPVDFDTISQMIETCERDTFTGDRDMAILLCLLDTGARASEFLAINCTSSEQMGQKGLFAKRHFSCG